MFLLLGGVALFWVSVAIRVLRSRADPRWKLGPEAPVEASLPPLVVVIPVRDEARNIGDCLAALRASDHPSLEVVVFDDGSTDATADLARAAGVEPIPGGGGPLPAGWKGKPWALHRATAALADRPWLIFVDADVRVCPQALSRLHSYAIRENADLVSGFGRLEMGSFWEFVIQPSVGGLILAGNDLGRMNDDERRDKAIANGQLILVRGETYRAVGGHVCVASDILDDIGMAKAFKQAGHKVRCLMIRELFACRMYTGFAELWHGWTKNLYPGMEFRPGVVLLVVALVLVEFLSPYAVFLGALATGQLALAGVAAGVVALIHAVRAWMDQLFDQSKAYGILQPLGALLLVGLVLDSVRRTRSGTRTWKGRVY